MIWISLAKFLVRGGGVALAAAGLAACGGGAQPSVGLSGGGASVSAVSSDVVNLANLPVFTANAATSGVERFSVSAYGVAASPRVTRSTKVQRGGGRQMVGRPYTVRGRTYHPTANQPRKQEGRASWYGAAFHGRKTANGEIYDMNHLTAAHKTMPLPSYARVTNKANGRSVVVRVNDRGPFSDNRVIDLSKRAAYMLDFISDGTANVTVEYMGPAPLDGEEDEVLILSFRGAPTTGAPGDRGDRDVPNLPGLPNLPGVTHRPGVMVASAKLPQPPQPAPERWGTGIFDPMNSMLIPARRPMKSIYGSSAYAAHRVAEAFGPFEGIAFASVSNWKTSGTTY